MSYQLGHRSAVTLLGLEKVAATFYRGMGSSFVPDVLKNGLPEGVYMSEDPAVGEHYSHTGANNVLSGDHIINPRPGTVNRDVQRMQAMGFDPQYSKHMAPNHASPTGSVLEINVPDGQGYTYRGGVARLKEHVAAKTIPPEHVRVLSSGALPTSADNIQTPGIARRLTPETLRRAAQAHKRGVNIPAVVSASGVPDTFDFLMGSDRAGYLRATRAARGLLRSRLRDPASARVNWANIKAPAWIRSPKL